MKIVDLGFTILHLHDGYGISHIKDDVVIDQGKTQELIDAFSNFYQGKPFVYLSLRKKNYNVNPTVYLDLDKENKLLGIGIACERPEKCVIANFEKQFCKIPFEIFYSLDEAIKWAEKLQENKKAGL